jgi:carbamoyl-phosphate synthase large subunit
MPNRKDPLPVLVTGVGGGGFGEQILKALGLADTPYEIIGTDVTTLSKGFAQVDHRYVVPPASDSKYVGALLDLCARHDIRAVFPGSEPELRVLAANADRFQKVGVFLPVNPSAVLDVCLDKASTMGFPSHGRLRSQARPTCRR